jgi:hypothetical protein
MDVNFAAPHESVLGTSRHPPDGRYQITPTAGPIRPVLASERSAYTQVDVTRLTITATTTRRSMSAPDTGPDAVEG